MVSLLDTGSGAKHDGMLVRNDRGSLSPEETITSTMSLSGRSPQPLANDIHSVTVPTRLRPPPVLGLITVDYPSAKGAACVALPSG